ncbi:MAG: MMPL family transporter, partial [Acidobacteriota bacterium]
SLRTSGAMLLGLLVVPLLVLGGFGWSRQPLDLISSPAANVAIALGIDSMIHLVTAVRRRRQAGDDVQSAWAEAIDRLWPAVLGATLILAAGFGLFALSSFPPTGRFGVAVASGTAVAAAVALLVLPTFASMGSPSTKRSEP